MLYSVPDIKEITTIPHRVQYDQWKSRLSDDEYEAIVQELNDRIEGDEIHTSSWIPGSDWSGTVFSPIYEKSCGRNRTAAGMFFGLILWEVLQNHEDAWAFGRYKKGDLPIEGMTYFMIHLPTNQTKL